MCPLCLSTGALIAAGVTSTGGLATWAGDELSRERRSVFYNYETRPFESEELSGTT